MLPFPEEQEGARAHTYIDTHATGHTCVCVWGVFAHPDTHTHTHACLLNKHTERYTHQTHTHVPMVGDVVDGGDDVVHLFLVHPTLTLIDGQDGLFMLRCVERGGLEQTGGREWVDSCAM